MSAKKNPKGFDSDLETFNAVLNRECDKVRLRKDVCLFWTRNKCHRHLLLLLLLLLFKAFATSESAVLFPSRENITFYYDGNKLRFLNLT